MGERILGAIVAVCAAACVGDSGNASDTFVGTWTCDITQTVTVNSRPPQPEEETDTVLVSSTGPGVLLVDDQGSSGDCTFTASFSGGTAAVTGGTCALDDGQGDTAKATFNGGTFILDGSGKGMSGNATASVMGVFGGTNVTGTETNTFTCTR
ncbi:MAG TPA: hypothetical protein VGH28_22210 [Polyangiaceae bacterium]